MDFIHTFISTPNGRNVPTLVLLHGTGGDENDLVSLGQFLDPNAALLGIRGKVIEGTSLRYFRRLAEGVFDEEDLVFRTHELADFLREATKKYELDDKRLIAVGYSNGANIAASLMLLRPDIFRAAILLRAMVPLQPQSLPNLNDKHILMLSGKHDPIILPSNSEQLRDIFSQCGADVSLQWEDAGHGLMQSEIHTAQIWLQSFLNKIKE